MKKILFLVAAVCLSFVSCKKDNEEDDNNNGNVSGGGGGVTQCDNTLLPVVMVHGFLASGDTYANQTMRFTSNKYCSDRLFVFDWNTLAQGADNASLLEAFIDEVLAKTNAEKVNLVGHSAGGGLGYNYLSDPERSKKVAFYVHIGSGSQSGPAGANGEVPTLNIWSSEDLIVSSADIPGATNVRLPGKDHYEVATCAETFEAMYKFFNNGKAPQTTDIMAESNVKLSGRVVTLGENQPRNGAEVKVYEVDSQTGFRKSESPNFVFTTDAKGNWGPIQVLKGAYYEFEVNTKVSGDRVIYYYREGFQRSNQLVYLRTLPPAGSFVSLLFAGIPNNANQTVLTVFAANQGISAGRDVLKVKNYVLSNETFCAPSNNTIALFMYDGNNNGQSDLTSQGFFGQFPFLSSADVFIPTTTKTTVTCELNGRKLNVENKKSNEGIVIAVFD